MIPAELSPAKRIRFDEGGRNIVIMTGDQLRHDRLALRLQEEFGHLVVGWFQIKRPRNTNSRRRLIPTKLTQRIQSVLRDRRRLVRSPSILLRKLRERNQKSRITEIEKTLFGDELELLRQKAHLEPTVVSDANAPEVVDRVKALDPFFLLTLGGPIYKAPLIECAKGLALNQHDGWCPTYRGARSVDWTLYHRDVEHLGNTIHVLTSGMDAGPILRRSTVCITDEDTRESCFARVVALGTELMCEVVAEIIRTNEVTVYEQPDEFGATYLVRQLKPEVKRAIDDDFRNGWLGFELRRLRRF